jgi:succinoglycan biosynthesis transport protein ExoP
MSIANQPSAATNAVQWDLARVLSVGWRHKGKVIFCMLAGIGVGAALCILLPPVYQSTAQISVLKKRPDSVTGVDTRQLVAEDYLAPPQDMLKSSLILGNAIRSSGISALPTSEDGENDPVEKVRKSFAVTPGKGQPGQNLVFKLSYRAGDVEGCQTTLTAILDSFQDFINRKHNTISVDSIELILREKQALQKNIEEKEAAYRAFRETAPLLGTGKDGVELRQERLNSIQTKRSALLLQRIELEGQLAAFDAAMKEGRSQEAVVVMLIEFARKNDAPEAGRDRTVSVQDQLLPLLQEEQKLLQIHGAKHPEVVAVKNRIEVTRRLLLLPPSSWKSESGDGPANPTKLIDESISLHVQLLTQKLSLVKSSEETLAKVFQTEQDEARRLTSYEIQNDSFRTSIKLNEQLYEALAKRLNEASLIKNVGGYQVEMIEPPSLGKRVAPSMLIMLPGGGFLGIITGFLLACWANRRFEVRVA